MITATLVLILLHAPNGNEILLNPREVTSLHAAIPGKANRQFDNDVKCVINTTDGKFVSVVETCEEVSRAIQQPRARK